MSDSNATLSLDTMGRITRIIFWIDDLVLKLCLGSCAFILVAMIIIEALGVIFRFVLHSSLSWSDEFVAYLFVWLTCLGAAAGFKLRAHPEVKALVVRLPHGMQQKISVVTDLVVLGLGIILVKYGGEMIGLMGMETASSLPISMTYPYLSIPVGGAALIIHSAVHILRVAVGDTGQSKGASVPAGTPEDVLKKSRGQITC
jgi:TRAP-type C4-dicarboxylate transport system permease small subunit